jgi:hypothetical protein
MSRDHSRDRLSPREAIRLATDQAHREKVEAKKRPVVSLLDLIPNPEKTET